MLGTEIGELLGSLVQLFIEGTSLCSILQLCSAAFLEFGDEFSQLRNLDIGSVNSLYELGSCGVGISSGGLKRGQRGCRAGKVGLSGIHSTLCS